ncbi:sugar phosphate isomerase/epimerase [Oscillospiraceae bacterium HV4-5-C5C]|nr:sugar phosphate isomerase/epimerase [Oscillospiraceae bacterium HV4-5-C5C]
MANVMGLATCFFREPTVQKWQAAAAAGFTEAEIDVDGRQSVEDICCSAQRQDDCLRAGGLQPSSLHLPFGNAWDLSAEDPARARQALTGLARILRWAAGHQIMLAVLHASFEPIPPERRSVRLEQATAGIRQLAQLAQELGVRLAVEDLPRTCLGNCADELLQLTDHGRTAGVCFDVNHLLRETHQSFISKLGSAILTTHLSDYDRLDERHWAPGEGCIDWTALKQQLLAEGYQGRWLFEFNELAAPRLGRAITPAELAARFKAY